VKVVCFFVIYLFRITIGYSMNKGKGVVNKEISCDISNKRRVKHKLQRGKGNFAWQQAIPLLYVGYAILGRW